MGDVDGGPPLGLNSLPHEIILLILQSIDAPSLCMVERVSTQWRKSAQTDALWQNLALRGWDWLLRWKPRALTWKQTYRRLDESNGAAFHVIGGA